MIAHQHNMGYTVPRY